MYCTNLQFYTPGWTSYEDETPPKTYMNKTAPGFPARVMTDHVAVESQTHVMHTMWSCPLIEELPVGVGPKESLPHSRQGAVLKQRQPRLECVVDFDLAIPTDNNHAASTISSHVSQSVPEPR